MAWVVIYWLDSSPALLLPFGCCKSAVETGTTAKSVQELGNGQVDDVLQGVKAGEQACHAQLEAPAVRNPVTGG
jgi:hypothetical protein